MTPVVDFALTLPGVDSTKLVLVCPREYVIFAAEDDVSGHCEMTARRLFHQRVYDWLDGVLELTPTARERDGE